MAACLAIVVPYVAFNLRTAGFIFPTTFYAKQAEYAAVIERLSLPMRFDGLLTVTLVGAQILLVPGFLAGVVLSIKRRTAPLVLLWAWWGCALALYAVKLPVAYQHGRYLMPTIPVFILLGMWGSWELWQRIQNAVVLRIIGRAWAGATTVVLIAFWIIGARAYNTDVQFINGEMGETASWLAQHAPSGARIAVHDIGVVGYVLERPFIDLAGLITPEVIPFIDDEERLLAFMESKQVEYVVVFPDWSDAYMRMTRDPRLTLVHSSNYAWTLAQGKANLSVYHSDWAATK
jgi:hypothetical protein